jgi:hypothetical protein
MKQLALALILLTASACNSADDKDSDLGDMGSFAGKEPIKMTAPEQIPTLFIPDTMWVWHSWTWK